MKDTPVDEKYNQIAREMFQNYLQYEKLMKDDAKSSIEKQLKPIEKNPAVSNNSGMPRIKEGSARMIKKNRGPNPYTGIDIIFIIFFIVINLIDYYF